MQVKGLERLVQHLAPLRFLELDSLGDQRLRHEATGDLDDLRRGLLVRHDILVNGQPLLEFSGAHISRAGPEHGLRPKRGAGKVFEDILVRRGRLEILAVGHQLIRIELGLVVTVERFRGRCRGLRTGRQAGPKEACRAHEGGDQ